MHWLVKGLTTCVALCVIAVAGIWWYLDTSDDREPSKIAFEAHCASCHGIQLEGTETAACLWSALISVVAIQPLR